MRFLHLTLTAIIWCVLSNPLSAADRQFFDKSKDLLLAQYDLRPDEDDVYSAAAFGSMLLHDDLNGVNYYAVAGAYGRQDSDFIDPVVPDFFTLLFGAKNTGWTDAHNDRSGSLTRVKAKIKTTIDNGGKVFIAEGGQSDFTHDVLQSLISDGMAAATIKAKVIVVQHSWRNEADDMSTKSKLTWVKANTDYEHIDDGNRNDNDTPGYATAGTSYLNNAKSTSNTNAETRNIWTTASNICKNYTSSYENPKIAAGGLDFSDHVEIWWILNQGSSTFTVSSFWSRYVVESGSGGGGGPIGTPGLQEPYNGANALIPGTIEAEEYDLGGKDVAFYDNTTGNTGGSFRTDDVDVTERDGGNIVGWTKDGEWLEYTVDALTGKYNITVRIATPETGKQLKMFLDDSLITTFDIAGSTSWHDFIEITNDSIDIKGDTSQILRVYWEGGEVNLNWVKFEGGPPPSKNDIKNASADAIVEAGEEASMKLSYEAVNNMKLLVSIVNKSSGSILSEQSFVKGSGRGNLTVDMLIADTTAPGSYEWNVDMILTDDSVLNVIADSINLDLEIKEKFIPPPSAGGIKIGENFVVIEAEATSSPLGKWVMRVPGDSEYKIGKSGLGPINDSYIEFTGNNINGGTPTSPLVYKFVAPKTGSYRLSARMLQNLKGAENDKCNDIYIRMAGDFESGGSYNTSYLQSDMKFYGRGLDTWGNMYHGETDKAWKQPCVYKLKAGEEYTFTVSGRAQRTCIDYFIFFETSISFKGLGEPSKGGDDIAKVNDEKYRPDPKYLGECTVVKAVDFDKFTGISGFSDAETDSRGGKDILSAPEALKTSAALLTYTGDDAYVFFKINTMLETDGESKYRVYINGKEIGEVVNPRIHGTSTSNYTIKEHQVNHSKAALLNGDEIRVEFDNVTNGLINESGSPVGTATARARWYSLEICVAQGDVPQPGISMSKKSHSMNVGASFTLSATSLPANATIQWSSSKSDIVSIDQNGAISGVVEGKATIYAQIQVGSDSYMDSCLVTINKNDDDDDDIVSIVLNKMDKVIAFPNPTTNILNIESPVEITGYVVYDLQGRTLLSETVLSPQVQIDMQLCNPGMYIVKVSLNGFKDYYIKVEKE